MGFITILNHHLGEYVWHFIQTALSKSNTGFCYQHTVNFLVPRPPKCHPWIWPAIWGREHLGGYMWMFPKIEVPQNGWFTRENLIKMDDLGVPLFSETPIWIPTGRNHVKVDPPIPTLFWKIQVYRIPGPLRRNLVGCQVLFYLVYCLCFQVPTTFDGMFLFNAAVMGFLPGFGTSSHMAKQTKLNKLLGIKNVQYLDVSGS